MAKVYKRHELIKEVYEACVAGEVRRLETLTQSKFMTPGQREEQLPSKWEFQESGEEFSLLGQTPLHVAAEKGFVDVVRVLVQRMGVDLDVPDDAGWTALHWASAIRREKGAEACDIVKILLDAGAEVGAVTKDKGDSALHFAAANGHLEAVKLLCEKGANVNRINEEDSTPVHVAAQRGNTDIIKFLNSNGGDISRRDSAGEVHAGDATFPYIPYLSIFFFFLRGKRNPSTPFKNDEPRTRHKNPEASS